jgi:hypothetical protein
MNNIFDKLEKLAQQRLMTRLKHLRGRHNQLDHAWNRGMGRGDSGGGSGRATAAKPLAPNQTGPVPNEQMYRKQVAALEDQVRQGKITRAQSREQLAILRGNTSRNSALLNVPITLANRKKPKPNPDQMTLDLFENSEPTPTPAPTLNPASTPTPAPTLNPASTPKPKPASPALSVSEDTLPVRQRSIAGIMNFIRDAIPPRIQNLHNTFQTSQAKLRSLKLLIEKQSEDLARSRELAISGQMPYEVHNKRVDEYQANLDAFDDTLIEFKSALTELARNNDVLVNILESLHSENPETVRISSSINLDPLVVKEIERFVNAVVGLLPKDTTKSPIHIYIQEDPTISGASYQEVQDDITNAVMSDLGIMTINPNLPNAAYVVCHETIHALQHQRLFGKRETAQFAAKRTAGEKPVALSALGYGDSTLGGTYIDHTDSDYTFRTYPHGSINGYGPFLEVLATAVNAIMGIHTVKDTELIELLIQAVKKKGK